MLTKLLHPAEITPLLVSMTSVRFKLDGVSKYKCCNKACSYSVTCTFIPSKQKYRVLLPIQPHSCAIEPSCRDIQVSRSKRKKNQYTIRHSIVFSQTEKRHKFSPSQISYLQQWCKNTPWTPMRCELPSADQLQSLQREIGKSPDLSRWFVNEIRKLVGQTVRLFAWHFDVGEHKGWSRMVFGNEWSIAYCHGTVVGVEIGKGFVTRMYTYRNTPPWESVLSPDILEWPNKSI